MQVEGVESVGSPLEKKKKKKKKKRRDLDSGGDISVSGPASGAGLAPLAAPGRGLGKGLAPLPSIGDFADFYESRLGNNGARIRNIVLLQAT